MAATQQIQIDAINAAMEHLHFTKERADEVIQAVLGSDSMLLANKAGKRKTKRVQKEPGEKRKQTAGQMAYKSFLSENLAKLKTQIAAEQPELSKKEVQNEAMKQVGAEWKKLQAEKSSESASDTGSNEVSDAENEPSTPITSAPSSPTTPPPAPKKAKVVKKGGQ